MSDLISRAALFNSCSGLNDKAEIFAAIQDAPAEDAVPISDVALWLFNKSVCDQGYYGDVCADLSQRMDELEEFAKERESKMIITKKAYNEAIAKTKEEMCRQFEAHDNERQQQRWTANELCDIRRRMDVAFDDINRRLDALEKQNVNRDIVECRRY